MTNDNDDAPSPYWVTVSANTPPSPSDGAPNDADPSDLHTSPSAVRNTQPIVEVLSSVLPDQGTAVEIASGTGQHAVAFATQFPRWNWIPSDPHPAARSSIAAWKAKTALKNLGAPVNIDLTKPDWHDDVVEPVKAILAINVVHISPWTASLGLVKGAAATLPSGGLLFVYSCFSRDGVHLSDSNIAFDKSLRTRNPLWGVRDTSELASAGQDHGLDLQDIIEMPANNLSLIFRKTD